MNTSHRTEVLNEYFPGYKLLVVITTKSSKSTNLAGVLPVHGVDGRAGVHVHEVVMMVARHHSSSSVMELHG